MSASRIKLKCEEFRVAGARLRRERFRVNRTAWVEGLGLGLRSRVDLSGVRRGPWEDDTENVKQQTRGLYKHQISIMWLVGGGYKSPSRVAQDWI